MLVRSLKIPPSLLLLLLFCGLLVWQFREAPLDPVSAPQSRPPLPPPVDDKPAPAPAKKHQAVLNEPEPKPKPKPKSKPEPLPAAAKKPATTTAKKPMRVALVTFVTEERSYLHISLKSKDRTWHA